jgi:excisionase family DNA binding protein
MVSNDMNKKMLETNDYLTVENIIKILKISRTTAYSFIHSGQLKSYKIGRLVRIKSQDLERFVEARPFKKKKGRKA